MSNAPGRFPVKAPEWSMWFDTYAPPTPWSLSRQPRRVRAGWKKVLATGAAVAVAGVTGWGLLTHLLATERGTALVLGAAAGIQLIRGFLWWERFEHDRTVVRPLASRTAGVLDQAVGDRRTWLKVPWDYRINPDATIRIDVPADFTAAERDMEDITRAVTVSTGWVAPQVEPLLKSRKPRLVYSQNKPPPLAVSLADIKPRIEAAKPSVVVLGYAAGFEPVEFDLDSETPHVGISIKTGGGKTEVLKNVGAQSLYHGAIVMILDYKLTSHMWADMLPNVSYARTPQEIQRALMWLAWDEYDDDGNIIRSSELTRRKQAVLAAKREGKPVPPWPRIVILAEERNATSRAIRRYHKRTGGKGTAPALEAMDETGETGRFIGVNAMHAFQRMSAKASGSDGSRDAIENICGTVAKDPDEQTWKLIGRGHTQPPKSGHKGRYQWITDAGVTDFQGVLYHKDVDESDRIARELAMSGTVASPPADMPFVYRGPLLVPAGMGQLGVVRQEGSEQAFDLRPETPSLATGEGPARAVKLAEAVAGGLFVSIAAARKVAQRQGWEPVGGDRYTGFTYSVQDIYAYLRAKESR